MKKYDHNRVTFRYDPRKAGYIEIRKEALFLSLGKYAYVQGRIALDNGKYIKGLMRYSNDIPDGYDILVNFRDWKSFWLCNLNLESENPFAHPGDKRFTMDDLTQIDNGCIYGLNIKDDGWMKWSRNYRDTATKIIGRKPKETE